MQKTVNCCQRTFSVKDPSDYIYFDLYSHPPTKSHEGEIKCKREYTLILNCPVCLKQKAIISRFSKCKILLRTLKLNVKNTIEHLDLIKIDKKVLKIKCPAKKVPTGQNIQLFYGHPESKTETVPTSLDGYITREPITKDFKQNIDPTAIKSEPKYIKIPSKTA